MPQAIQIETQSEQQGLAHLHAQRAAWCTGGELSLHRREDTLDQGAASIQPSRKRPPHLSADSLDAPSLVATLGRDHALCSELPANIGMISLAVEFGVGQHQSDTGLLSRNLTDNFCKRNELHMESGGPFSDSF